MKKRFYNSKFGFTLVELLSVIALLATLAIIVIPNIDKILRNSKEDLYSKQLLTIETAAKLWSTDEENSLVLKNNEVWPYVITLADLQASNYIDENIKNPKTDDFFSGNLLIYIEKGDNKYIYSVDEATNDTLAPIVTLNGSSVIELEIGRPYNEQNATAVTPNNTTVDVTKTIKQNGVQTTINNMRIGTYTITYSATYTADGVEHTGVAVRILKFIDTTKPILTCSSCSNGNITIESSENYELPSVTVTDNSGESINAIITGSFSPRIPGTKKVIYQATDSSGNTGSYELNVTVKDTSKPTFIYTSTMEFDNIRFEIIANDNGSGVKEYSFDGGNTWQKNSTRNISCDVSVIQLQVRDFSNNFSTQTVEIICTKEWNYMYTGYGQTFPVPYNGNYKLEVWGAQGGSSLGIADAIGGYGGYSSGVISLNALQNLYVYVGGKGLNGTNDATTKPGGYNGGGTKVTPDSTYYSASGGGATHIALVSGLLSELSERRNDILIVAGGGGGGAGVSANYGLGGAGGGDSGQRGTNYKNNVGWGAGGTQSEGGCKTNFLASGNCGSFGLGNSTSSGHGGAGGGGFYGGGSSDGSNIGGGGGGSGYIGNSMLTNKYMYCYNCTPSDLVTSLTYQTPNVSETPISNYAKIGNGYARITYLG